MATSQVTRSTPPRQSKKTYIPHPVSNILLNGGELGCAGDWVDRWIGPNTIERVGTLTLESSDGEVENVEFTAIITLGKLLRN